MGAPGSWGGRTSGGAHVEYTNQMRSYGMYVYGPRGQEILFDALRGCKEYDDPDVSLRTPWVRRKSVTVEGLGSGGPAVW
jgi:hypothetical protein